VVFQNDPGAIKRYAPFFKPLDVPTSKIDDAPYVCVRLNSQWIPFLLGAVETLRWPDLYKGTEAQIEAATQEVERLFLAFAQGNIPCPEDAMIQLQQNPEDPCQLQISYDDGQSWELAFDYSLCMGSQTTINVTVQNAYDMSVEIENNMTVYNNDITNVYENWGYGDADDIYRDDAMCWAVRQWIDIVCEFAIKQLYDELDEEKDFLHEVADGLKTVGGLTSAMVSFALFPPWAAYAALAFTIAGSATALYAELLDVDPSALLDEEAREDVACHVYSLMAGTTPTFAAWSSSLDNHGLSGNAGKIANAARAMMQSEETFVQFFKLVGDMIDVAKAGADLGCPCEGDWVHTWLFDTASGSEAHTTYDNNTPQWSANNGGVYNLVNGGWCSTEEDLGDYGSDRVNLTISFATRTITRIRFEADYTEGFIKQGEMGRDAIKIYVFTGSEVEVFSKPFAYQENGIEGWEWTGIRPGVTKIRVMWRCSYSEATPPYYGDGDVILFKAIVEGNGVCPFG
jgi:hypothetical protein